MILLSVHDPVRGRKEDVLQEYTKKPTWFRFVATTTEHIQGKLPVGDTGLLCQPELGCDVHVPSYSPQPIWCLPYMPWEILKKDEAASSSCSFAEASSTARSFAL